MTKKLFAGAACLQLLLSGCGMSIPQVHEIWEGTDVDHSQAVPVDRGLALQIKTHIFCELVNAIVDINKREPDRKPRIIPDDLGVQLQTTITIDENSALNAGVTLNRTLPNGSASGVTIGQSSNLGFGASGSTDVQRVDTAYTYWRVEKITTKHNIEQCRDNDHPNSSSSPLLRSNLGIEDYLLGATSQANFLHSSEAGKAKAVKLDVFSYELKFIVVTSGNINPTWKLVSVSSSNSVPFFNTARTRTHDLILTFGPNAEQGLGPSYIAATLHQNSGLKAVLDSKSGGQ